MYEKKYTSARRLFHNFVHVVGCLRKKNHRYFGDFANLLAPVKSVKKGKMNIHQHQLRAFCGKFGEDIGKILHAECLHAPRNQTLLHGAGDDLVIFYDLDTPHS